MTPAPTGPVRGRRWTWRRIAGLVAVAAALAIGIAFARFAAHVEALRARRASGPSYGFPSRVYADGLTLEPGRSLARGYLADHLAERGYRAVAGDPRAPGTYAWTPGGVTVVLRGFLDAPDPDGQGGPERVHVELSHGRIARVDRRGGIAGAPPPDLHHPPRLEPFLVATLRGDPPRRAAWVPLARVPEHVRAAVVAAEDRRFERHMGIDLRSNLRALRTNVSAGGVREGGSTITQQLARGLFLGRQRTFDRKLREIGLALGLELLLSKDRILEMYLNSVYWGQSPGGAVHGIAEAALWYFDAPVESLTVDQAALLAGVIPAPNVYSPFRSRRRALSRRNAVLADMVETGALPQAEAEAARRRPLGVRRGGDPPQRFPSFMDAVRIAMRAHIAEDAAETWGLAVLTTLDPVWQARAERKLAEGVADLERWRGRLSEPLQGALVAIEPHTGHVVAVVGGRRPGPEEFNRALHARRQPGSAIKPIVYAAALDPARPGKRFTPATTVPDLRREFATPEGPWEPRNDEGDYHPQVTLAKALAKSLNLATANLVEQLGAAEVARYVERFGLGRAPAVPSIGLGTHEVTLLDLTNAYATFANGGERVEATPLRAVMDGQGTMLLHDRPETRRVLSPTTAALMRGLLEDVVIFGVSYPLRARYGFVRPVGGKTGTTNDYRDAWFVGFTPELAAGVWVGYDAPQSLARPAAETALPLWAGIMGAVLDGFPPSPFPVDPAIELVWIDPWSGGLARGDCPSPLRVPFTRGSVPREPCRLDHAADWVRILEARRADSLATATRDSAHALPDSSAVDPSLRGPD